MVQRVSLPVASTSLDALLFLALCKAIDILIAVLRAFSHGTRRTRTVAQNDELRPISAAISTPHRNTTHVRRGLTLALETLFRAASRFLLRIAVDPMPLEEVDGSLPRWSSVDRIARQRVPAMAVHAAAVCSGQYSSLEPVY